MEEQESLDTGTNSTVTPPTVRLCSMCDKPGTNVCKGCHCSHYCSVACQKDDWKVHKLLCKEFQDYSMHSRPPEPDYYRAICFPVRGGKPRFAWLSLNFTIPRFVRLQERTYNDVLKRSHRHITIFRIQETVSNSLNKNLAAINKKLHLSPIGLLQGSFSFHGQLSHLDTTDFRHIVDWLRTDHYRVMISRQRLEQHKDVRGVRINCWGDVNISSRPEFEAAHIPTSMLDSPESALRIPIADKLGFPLILRSIPHALPWRGRHIDANTSNTQAYDQLFCELNPAQWLEKTTGSILVARNDGKPLYPAHVEALHAYCRCLAKWWGEPMPLGSIGPEHDGKGKIHREHLGQAESMVLMARKEEFLVYWKDFMDTTRKERYGVVVSPYEV